MSAIRLLIASVGLVAIAACGPLTFSKGKQETPAQGDAANSAETPAADAAATDAKPQASDDGRANAGGDKPPAPAQAPAGTAPDKPE